MNRKLMTTMSNKLTLPERLLQIIGRNRSVTLQELTDETGLLKNTVSRVVNKLLDQKCLKQARHDRFFVSGKAYRKPILLRNSPTTKSMTAENPLLLAHNWFAFPIDEADNKRV